jgi:hypothetical protein
MNLSEYSSPYGTPQSQGPQGQQGASQQPTPDSIYNPQRSPMWKPAPSSTSQASTSQTGSQNLYDYARTSQAASGSPVTANGQIAPPAPSGGQTGSTGASSPAQGSASSAEPKPEGMSDQDWVNFQARYRQPAQQPQQIDQGGYTGNTGRPQGPQYSPYGPYPNRPQNTTYQPGQLAPQTFNPYQATQFNPYQQMDFSGIQGQQNQLLSQVLSNPVFSDQVVQQMKAKQRESAMAMAGQQQQMAAQDAASRGTNLDSQYNNTQNAIQGGMRENVLGAYRDIDINAANSNRQGQLAALGAAEQVMSGQLGRHQNQFSMGMAGQSAQAGENQFAHNAQFGPAQYALQAFAAQQGANQAGAGSALDSHKTDLGAFFDWQNNQNQKDQLALQGELGRAGIGVDNRRLDQDAQQFGANNKLNWAQLMNDMQMGRYGLGLDYAKLQQQGQSDFFRSLGF